MVQLGVNRRDNRPCSRCLEDKKSAVPISRNEIELTHKPGEIGTKIPKPVLNCLGGFPKLPLPGFRALEVNYNAYVASTIIPLAR